MYEAVLLCSGNTDYNKDELRAAVAFWVVGNAEKVLANGQVQSNQIRSRHIGAHTDVIVVMPCL